MDFNLKPKVFFAVISFSYIFCAELASATPFDLDFGEEKHVKSPLGDYRVLAICLPDHATIKSKQADPLYASLDWKGFEARDLVVVEMRKYFAHLVTEHQRGKAVPRYKTAYSENYRIGSRKKGLFEVAKCENKLEYVLIGKDQTQKARWDLFPSNENLYSTIDAMPMRRFEMRQQEEKN